MTKWLAVSMLGGALLLGGCQTTDNPREGGLFSYNPKAYEQRLEERRQELEEAKQEQAEEQRKKEELEAQADEKRSQRDALAAELDDLDQEIARVEKRIAGVKAGSKKLERKRWEINTRLRSIKRQIQEVKADQSGSVETREQEIKSLKERIDKLLEEAEALSQM